MKLLRMRDIGFAQWNDPKMARCHVLMERLAKTRTFPIAVFSPWTLFTSLMSRGAVADNPAVAQPASA